MSTTHSTPPTTPSAVDRVLQIAELRHLILHHLLPSPADLLRLSGVNITLRRHILSDPLCRRSLYLDAATVGPLQPDPSANNAIFPTFIPSRSSGCEHLRSKPPATFRRFTFLPADALPADDPKDHLQVILNPLLRQRFPELVFMCSLFLVLRRPLPLDDPRTRGEASCREMLLTQPPLTSVELWDSGHGPWAVEDAEGVRMGQVLDEVVRAQERRLRQGVYV